MFEPGQRVRHKRRDVTGTVVEIDRGTVYLETASGVEMQFSLDELQADNGTAVPAAAAAAEDPRFAALFARLPPSVTALAAVTYARAPGTARNGWPALPDRLKLDWVSRVTALDFDRLKRLMDEGKGRQIEAHASVARGKGF